VEVTPYTFKGDLQIISALVILLRDKSGSRNNLQVVKTEFVRRCYKLGGGIVQL